MIYHPLSTVNVWVLYRGNPRRAPCDVPRAYTAGRLHQAAARASVALGSTAVQVTQHVDRRFRVVHPQAFSTGNCSLIALLERSKAFVSRIMFSAAVKLDQSSAATHLCAKSITLMYACGSPARLNVRRPVR